MDVLFLLRLLEYDVVVVPFMFVCGNFTNMGINVETEAIASKVSALRELHAYI